MSEGFLTTPDTAMLFFRFCGRYKIQTKEDRIAVLREIVRRKKATYIRDTDTFLAGKRVVGFRPKGLRRDH